jgi:hypothetical protein
MSRILLQILLPLLLPTVAYFLWALLGRPGTHNVLEDTPWFWLIIVGVVLMGGGLVAMALTQGVDPGSQIIQPRLEDGRVVPAEVR